MLNIADQLDENKSVASLQSLSHEDLLDIAFEGADEPAEGNQPKKSKKKAQAVATGGLNRRPGFAESLGQKVRMKRAIFDAKDITVDLSFTIAVVGSEYVDCSVGDCVTLSAAPA
jgi:hypothetical protein